MIKLINIIEESLEKIYNKYNHAEKPSIKNTNGRIYNIIYENNRELLRVADPKSYIYFEKKYLEIKEDIMNNIVKR